MPEIRLVREEPAPVTEWNAEILTPAENMLVEHLQVTVPSLANDTLFHGLRTFIFTLLRHTKAFTDQLEGAKVEIARLKAENSELKQRLKISENERVRAVERLLVEDRAWRDAFPPFDTYSEAKRIARKRREREARREKRSYRVILASALVFTLSIACAQFIR